MSSTDVSLPWYEQPAYRLTRTDPWMGRIGEDMFAVLIAKGIIALTDLPAITQQKIQQRQQLRAQLSTEN